ncbi:hypothetical protein A3K87_04270 [Variovorax paradoxus]|uniref:Uncharacterized protein n=1 Tax=Variovorax paradoxus TaxID=34073 RepID=A0AA91DHW8_VARPD|nr:hypothetical protein [Variovorax paradoxus]OAK55021.1 hypothetical protein A3K87_04270 [Variovorax paradoxus]
MAKAVVPEAVSERFAPAERPTFRLLRRAGSCCLWRSVTVEHQVFGHTRPARVHYHVTEGEDACVILMPVFRAAMLNFELAVAEVSHG